MPDIFLEENHPRIISAKLGSVVSEEKIFLKCHPPFFLICIIGQNRQKFIKNPVIYIKKLIIMLIQFKFGNIPAYNRAVLAI